MIVGRISVFCCYNGRWGAAHASSSYSIHREGERELTFVPLEVVIKKERDREPRQVLVEYRQFYEQGEDKWG